ncbi:MAG: hypothetical protein ACRC2R_21945 [Xenococcaceae cyanobacterium]
MNEALTILSIDAFALARNRASSDSVFPLEVTLDRCLRFYLVES